MSSYRYIGDIVGAEHDRKVINKMNFHSELEEMLLRLNAVELKSPIYDQLVKQLHFDPLEA